MKQATESSFIKSKINDTVPLIETLISEARMNQQKNKSIFCIESIALSQMKKKENKRIENEKKKAAKMIGYLTTTFNDIFRMIIFFSRLGTVSTQNRKFVENIFYLFWDDIITYRGQLQQKRFFFVVVNGKRKMTT